MEEPNPEAYCAQCGDQQDTEGWLERRSEVSQLEVHCGNCNHPQNIRRFFARYDEAREQREEARAKYEAGQDSLYAVAANEHAEFQNRRDAVYELDETRLVTFVSTKREPQYQLFAAAIGGLEDTKKAITAVKRYENACVRSYRGYNEHKDGILSAEIEDLSEETLRAIISDKDIDLPITEKKASEILLARMNEPEEEEYEEDGEEPPEPGQGIVDRAFGWLDRFL